MNPEIRPEVKAAIVSYGVVIIIVIWALLGAWCQCGPIH